MTAGTMDRPLVGADFDGQTYDPEEDHERLTGQLLRVYEAMTDGHWRTLEDVAARIRIATGHRDTPAAISARIRDLRKARFGAYPVRSRRAALRGGGLWEYRIEGQRGTGSPERRRCTACAAVGALHQPDPFTDRCTTCAVPYPCPTALAIGDHR
jgi:hypothetical protein